MKRPRSYAEQTYASPHWIVRYPHRKRFAVACDAILADRPRALLDYGAGDGRLLVEALRRGLESDRVVAFEPVDSYSEACRAAVAGAGFADRVTVVGDRSALAGERFGFICCLGVLEHMPLPERRAFYAVCDATLAEGGRALIDVPVEVGPTLLVKQFGRMVLKGRPREYGWRDLARIALGGSNGDEGRFDPADTRTWIQDHHGFDYRLLREELESHFDLLGERTTPLSRLPAPFGNQEVFFTVGTVARGRQPSP